MFTLILQSAIVSAIFIFLIHYLVKFFKNTLTTPKIKDFVTLPTQKYKKMFDTMNGSQVKEMGMDAEMNATRNNSDTYAQPINTEDMKSELKNFMKNHLTPNDKTSKEEVVDFSFSGTGDYTSLSSMFSNY